MNAVIKDWFTIEALDAQTFAISEYGHWEETHCYLLCGMCAALLIDTGLGVADIRGVVDGLTSLPVLAAATHAHWDHVGGYGAFAHRAVHAAEAPWLAGQFPLPLPVVKRNLLKEPCAFPAGFQIDRYRVFQGRTEHILHDGDRIDLGGRRVDVLHTPGHSPGHCCFYEEERGYLFAGDLVYGGCLDAFYPTTDPALFRRSVKRLQSLAVTRVFPGHHRLHIDTGMIGAIADAFDALENAGRLRQGSGLFAFDDFQIHI